MAGHESLGMRMVMVTREVQHQIGWGIGFHWLMVNNWLIGFNWLIELVNNWVIGFHWLIVNNWLIQINH